MKRSCVLEEDDERKQGRENDVKCINGVKEEMTEDFSWCNMILQDREQFGQLYERDNRD